LRILLSLLFILSSCTCLIAQSNQVIGNSKKAKKLALSLTKNQLNDSAKVYAIHQWVTTHIKYDFKTLNNHQYDVVPIDKVLRKRKAICLGYAQLFETMCKHANINAVTIEGYLRNERGDVNDKLYMSNHAWNAVYVNGQWQLIDVCLDAGYMRYFKKKRIVFNGIPYRYQPKFIRKPSQNYYYRNPEKSIATHIPADANWQLLQVPITRTEIELDSSYYWFKEAPYQVEADNNNTPERQAFATANNEEKEFMLAVYSHAFNNRNHFDIGSMYKTFAQQHYARTDFKLKDTATLKKQCDSIIINVVKTVMHLDSNLHYIDQQKRAYTDNNTLKKKTTESQYSYLKSSTQQSSRSLESGIKVGKNLKRINKAVIKNGKERYKSLQKNTSYVNARLSYKPKFTDSVNIHQDIMHYSDSLAWINEAIKQTFKTVDALMELNLKNIHAYQQVVMQNNSTSVQVIANRVAYWDDLDFAIRHLQDSVLHRKFAGDALLLNNNRPITDSFYNTVRTLEKEFNTLYKYHRKMQQLYVRLKRASTTENNLSELHYNNIQSFKNTNAQYTQHLKSIYKKWKELNKACKSAISTNETELSLYSAGRSIENQLYKQRSKFINKQQIALKKLTNKNKREALKLYNKAESTKQKFVIE
jgi:hypothetical protein